MATKLASSSEVLFPGLFSGIPDSAVHWGITPNGPSVWRFPPPVPGQDRSVPPCTLCTGGFLEKVPAHRSSVMSPTVILEVTSSTLSWDSGTQSSLVLPFLNLGIFDAHVYLYKMTASQFSDIGVWQVISKNISTSTSVCSPGFLLIPRTFLFSFFFCFQSNIKKRTVPTDILKPS